MNGYCQCAEGIWQPSDNSGNGECKEITEGDCTTNADCKEGEYCAIKTTEKNCEKPNEGTCTRLDSVKAKEMTYNGKTFLYSFSSMHWWQARNWCLAHGKSLVSLSDLSCTTSGCEDWDALTAAFGDFYYWTNDNKSSCYVFVINPSSHYITNDDRFAPDTPLCR